MKFEISPLIQARPRWRSISSRAELISSDTGSTVAGFMSRCVLMIRCAMTRYCSQRNKFVYDNGREGFGAKTTRERIFSRAKRSCLGGAQILQPYEKSI